MHEKSLLWGHPGREIQPWVQGYFRFESVSSEPMIFLPGVSTLIIIRLDDLVGSLVVSGRCQREPTAYVTSILSGPSSVSRPPGARVFGIAFAPAAARPFVTPDLSALAGQLTSLDEVGLGALERLRGSQNFSAQCAIADRVLLRKLEQDHRRGDRRMRRVITEHLRHPPRVVNALASQAGVSERQLRRLYVEHIGATPWKIQRIIRARRALAAIRGGIRLVDVALGLGFSDQAHLSRECRQILGCSASGLRERFLGQGEPFAERPLLGRSFFRD